MRLHLVTSRAGSRPFGKLDRAPSVGLSIQWGYAVSLFEHRIYTDYCGLAERMRKCAAEAHGAEARRSYLLLASYWQRLADAVEEPRSRLTAEGASAPKNIR